MEATIRTIKTLRCWDKEITRYGVILLGKVYDKHRLHWYCDTFTEIIVIDLVAIVKDFLSPKSTTFPK